MTSIDTTAITAYSSLGIVVPSQPKTFHKGGSKMSRKWIHGIQPETSLEERTPDQFEMVDGELRPKEIPRGWKDGIRLVINGGIDSLDSATVPIEWFFSDELIAERPQYIVICDHEMPLSRLEEERYYSYGRRYLVKVTEFVKYLQLFKAGMHHLVFMVFCGDEDRALRQARQYVANHGDRWYDNQIYFSDVMSGWFHNEGAYVVHVEFNVPQGLLAEKPTSGFSKWVWDWTNRWFKLGPADECAYRKRLISAFTIQPPLFLIGRFFAGITITIFSLVAWVGFALIGWKPKSAFTNIKNGWIELGEVQGKMIADELGWRQLTLREYDHDQMKWIEAKYSPVWCVPIFLALEIYSVLVLYKLFHWYPIQMMDTLGIILTLVCMVLVVFLLLKLVNLGERLFSTRSFDEKFDKAESRFLAWQRNRRIKRENALIDMEKAATKQYFSQLATISLDTTPVHAKVDIDAVKKKVSAPISLKLSFWATKAKVCKPFSR